MIWFSAMIFGKPLDDDIERVRIFAERPGNWYAPGIGPVPGDMDAYTIRSVTIKAVFTWTQVNPSKVSRHLSISTRNEGKYPSPIVAYTLAHKFGFTGATPDAQGLVLHPPSGDSWGLGVNEDEGTLVIVQDVPTAVGSA